MGPNLIRVKGTSTVNKLFDAIQLRLKTQWKTSSILDGTHELKRSAERTRSAVPALINRRKDSLPLFGFARVLKQLDLGASMYHVEASMLHDGDTTPATCEDEYDPEKHDAPPVCNCPGDRSLPLLIPRPSY